CRHRTRRQLSLCPIPAFPAGQTGRFSGSARQLRRRRADARPPSRRGFAAEARCQRKRLRDLAMPRSTDHPQEVAAGEIAAQPVSRCTVQAFYRAYGSGDPKQVAAFLDDDIDWMVSGPVDVLRFCGQRRGKAAAVDVIERLIPSTFEFAGFEPALVLIDGDRAATLFTLHGILVEGKRRI